MSKNTIKILVSLGVVALLGATVYFLPVSKQQNQEQHTLPSPSATNSIATSTPPVSELETSEPVDRQNRIDHVLATKGKDYRRYSLTKDSPKNLIITYYQIDLKNLHAEDVALRRHQQGILVFKEKESGEIKLLWESNDYISQTRPIIGVYDLTGDGVNEILTLWQNGKYEDLYIYKWDGNGFDMISPYYDSKWSDGVIRKAFAFNARDSEMKIFDVDKDGIPEIIQSNNIIIRTQEDGFDLTKEVFHAYKWNGSKYYLWKEQEKPFTPVTKEGYESEYSVANVLYPLKNP